MEKEEFALPIHEQRLEKALRLGTFLDQVEEIIKQPLSDSNTDDDSETEEIYSTYLRNGLLGTKEEKQDDRGSMYNFSCVKKKRQWLKEALVSSSESESDKELNERDLQEMIREHKLRKKYQSQFYQKEENSSYKYFSSGFLSRVDRYPEHQKHLAGSKRKKNKEKKSKDRKDDKSDSLSLNEEGSPDESASFSSHEESSEDLVVNMKTTSRQKALRKDKKNKKLDAQALAIRRHKLWVLMAKKEVGRCHKSKASIRKEVLQNCKKMATGCMRFCRQKALQSQKTVKDKVWMLKRLTRTMQMEWKKYDKIMKEQNKRAEKEAEEQRKIDKEILEAKRQQRKVNFLITLPELYSHFMKNKLASSDESTNEILKQLEDEKPLPSSVVDDYDCEAMKAQALKTAQDAYTNQMSKMGNFSGPGKIPVVKEHGQPSSFVGELKSYQLKGMNWLANLYYFGINGILADEMGLGKTVQAVAFLAHICEEYDTWGPFLIVTPASTLHNWTCEISKFVPSFKVVPYWGNPEERKNLRKFFDGKNLGTKDASFDVVVTSYQIVIQDFKFLNRLKWNYMVLDEAQAIKSINSQRWKQLLGFSCRNRLLLSGTPIQNSMAELWALLHFIMPTLFDCHLWFNEWFSKDIEGHVENKTHVDEKHLNRLHMILKPFMLRRVKTEVENELSDKIEIMTYCPLTLRQKYLYDGLKNKISIDELLKTSVNNQSINSVTTSLMNLVMQFRKVCNHPELLERREVRSPLTMNPAPYVLPKLVYRECLFDHNLSSTKHLLYNRLSIFSPSYIHSSLFDSQPRPKCFSFLRFIDTSPAELSQIALEGILAQWILFLLCLKKALVRHLNSKWGSDSTGKRNFLLLDPPCGSASINCSDVLRRLVFTSVTSNVYTFTDHVIHFVPETLSHRIMRTQKYNRKFKIQEISSCDIKKEPLNDTVNGDVATSLPVLQPKLEYSPPSQNPTMLNRSPRKTPLKLSNKKSPIKKEVEESRCGDITILPELIHHEKEPIVLSCQPTSFPTFLQYTCAKAQATERRLYSYDKGCVYFQYNHDVCTSHEGFSAVHYGSLQLEQGWKTTNLRVTPSSVGGLTAVLPKLGWNHILIPDKHTLIMDAGKLYVLDSLLSKLKDGGHRVLIYSQMTKMIDLLEEYMWHRKHKYMRLDGSSKISDRRDMVEDFQNKSDIFVFLLSTRAGGVGINLTAADTVIFYDSDWNPTVDQQAMDRAHRLGQTKQVTVYRLICKSTIEERILQRAREKSEIQRMVISGGNFKPDTLKPKEVVSLLLEDDIEREYKAKQAEKRVVEDQKLEINREKMRERMRKRYAEKKLEKELEEKRRRLDDPGVIDVCGDETTSNSSPCSPEGSEGSADTHYSVNDEDDPMSDTNLLSADSEVNSPCTPTIPPATDIVALCGRRKAVVAPVRRKRGRPRRTSARDRVVNGSAEPEALVSTVNGGGDGSALLAHNRRGRGRPRLVSLGPGHMGLRSTPTLPIALGSTLGTNYKTQGNNNNP